MFSTNNVFKVFAQVSNHLYWGNFYTWAQCITYLTWRETILTHVALTQSVLSLWKTRCETAQFWHSKRVMLLAHVKLPMRCLTYVSARCLGWRRITRDWKSFSHSNRNAKYRDKKLILSKEVAETFVIVRKFTNFKYNNVNMIPAKDPAYFGWVPCGYGKTSPLHFVLWLELFSSSNPLANDPDKYGKQLACMYVWFVWEDTTQYDSWFCCCVIGHKNYGTNQKPELPWRFGTGPLKPCPQGHFSSFLTFLHPNFFPAFSNCPWVSKDEFFRARGLLLTKSLMFKHI